MSTSLSTLRTQVYDILREKEDSSSYPYTLVDSLINSAQLRICSGLIRNTFNNTAITKGALPFLEQREFYQNILSTSLTADATVWGTTLTVAETTDYPTSGYLWIQGDIVTYTGLTSTSFTGVTGIDYAHLSWTRVYPAFLLPTDYMSTIEVNYNNSLPIPYKASKQIYRDLIPIAKGYYNNISNQTATSITTPFNWQPPFYTLWDWAYFLPFWIDNSSGFFCLHYETKPTALSSGTDLATIPDDYAKNTIAYLATGEVLFNRWEESRASQLLTFAYGQIAEMYAFYNNLGSESMDWQQVSTEKQYLNL